MGRWYTVITADIVNSKRKLERPEELLLFQEKLEAFNTDFHGELVANFSLSRGDEIQGVINQPQLLLGVLRNLRYRLYPQEIKVGVGIGEISTAVKPNNSWEMNGEAFYWAREALDLVKKERWTKTHLRTGCFLLEKGSAPLLKLLDLIQDKWTPQQWEAIHLYEKTGTLKRAAEMLGIAFQNVEKRCTAAGWQVIKEVEGDYQELVKYLRTTGDLP